MALGVTAAAIPPADLLHPGKTIGLGFSISNPNAYPVELTELTGLAVTSSRPVSCPAASIVAEGLPRSMTEPILVTASATVTTALPGLIQLATTAPSACQGAQFTIALTFSGAQT